MSATIRVVSCVAHAASVIPITLTQLNFASKNQAGERVTTNEGQAPRAVLDVHLIMSRLSIGDHPESELLFIHRNASVLTIHKARNNNFITLGWFCYACDTYKHCRRFVSSQTKVPIFSWCILQSVFVCFRSPYHRRCRSSKQKQQAHLNYSTKQHIYCLTIGQPSCYEKHSFNQNLQAGDILRQISVAILTLV